MPTNQLPQDILIQIFLYLPFESIQACKLVSKQWKNVADDPRLGHPSFAPFLLQNFVYCVSTKITNPVKISSRCNPPLSVKRIQIEWKDDDESKSTQLLLESSKGIACVVTGNRRLLIYNLFIGASYPPTEVPKGGFLYGFGYDTYADDCKMMSVDISNSLFWVYSLRNRAWKSFEGFPHNTYYLCNWDEPRSCSLNGVLHWVVDKRGQEPAVILIYDLHTCRFGEMLLPSSDCYSYGTKVVELGGRLFYCSMDQVLTLWMMTEYGVSESWTRFLSIDVTKLSRRVLYKCQSGRNLLLFVCKHCGTLYWYDIDNGKVTRVQKNTWEKRMNRKRKTPELIEGMQQHIWLGR